MNPQDVATLQNNIGGERYPAQTGEWIDSLAPATGQLLHRIPRSGREDTALAVQAAQEALKGSWSRWSLEERAALCERIAKGLEARLEELAQAESRDTGKPIQLTRSLDIPRSIANFRFFAGAALHETQETFHQAGFLHYTKRRPIGIVGLITPWNLPLYLLTWKIAPALVMGNAIVAKPSEMTPWTATLLAEIMADAGTPKGVFNLLHGLGAEVGQAIVEHPEITAISFTGGTATGAKVAATATPLFKKLSLELGGKNPTILFKDANLDDAIPHIARAGFANQGQICLAGSRILIQRACFAEAIERLTHEIEAMPLGDPADEKTKLGALISAAHREKIERYVALARESGATLHTGGQRPQLPAPFEQGFFYTPTLLSGLPQSSPLIQEEIFGPVVTVQPFDDEEEALQLANGTRYGLSASLWTNDLQRAHRFSAALDCGMVWVNTWLQRDLRTPFGGFKGSGVGREGGTHSLDFFSEMQCITLSLQSASQAPKAALASFR